MALPALNTLTIVDLIRKRRSLWRELTSSPDLRPLRIAVLGGSTTNEVVDLLQLHLLEAGFQPDFYQSEYGRFYEDAVLPPDALKAFAPDLVYVHTCFKNVLALPQPSADEPTLAAMVEAEVERYRQIWSSLSSTLDCQIIQNNFELPLNDSLGNFGAAAPGGAVRFYLALNEAFAKQAQANPRLLLQDVLSLSARMGLAQWLDRERWFSYKLLLTVEASVEIARSLTAMVKALYGRSSKVLVLDLDNTLWGGVIGDDGVNGIQIGKETPLAEAFTEFQQYCLSLRDRGVLLAVCSKNDEAVAKSGFTHPDSVLRLEHISAFRANWQPKHENILSLAEELNLGLDSFVFADDNPAEREIVRAQLPAVAVPELGNNPAFYEQILQQHRYFEAVALSGEDLLRAGQYADNTQRTAMQAKFADYGEYLDSLQMTAEIETFKPIYLDRITQLTNKTNQFNLTTRRYTLAEMQASSTDPSCLGIYGKLTDRFGDNGLVSVVLGRRENDRLELDLWLMSCRVLKRDMELAMLDVLAAKARALGMATLVGLYLPSKKNGMVADHYDKLGFSRTETKGDGTVVYELDISHYRPLSSHIRLQEKSSSHD